jgi:hypothetical protein
VLTWARDLPVFFAGYAWQLVHTLATRAPGSLTEAEVAIALAEDFELQCQHLPLGAGEW